MQSRAAVVVGEQGFSIPVPVMIPTFPETLCLAHRFIGWLLHRSENSAKESEHLLEALRPQHKRRILVSHCDH
jgi:hypothetical protein